MKVVNSLKSHKLRSKDNYIVRRGKKIYVLNKKNRKYKVRQG